ncbi:MAG: class II D-tagatose-bisphosphate aldolase, non-catalytic subunit [Bacteroidales bacterium]|nr:class II D-tagatose-bisphosphate aldolase, non-catalytic subunit [Bacteroidales bacterium]
MKKPIVEHILEKIKEEKDKTGISRTLFAACPNSISVIKAALNSAKRCDSPIKFAVTLNQVDSDGGYTGMNQSEFVKIIHREAEALDIKGPVIIALDHGGPWLKDRHRLEKLSYEETMRQVKQSMINSLKAGYDLLHVDPTVDIDLKHGELINIETVANRTIELISFVEKYRRENSLPAISYEVGTEEVHGGLADLKTFNRFLSLLKTGLKEAGYGDVWPCFIVGKVGTDLHTTIFDPDVAEALSKEAAKYGSVIKGHYSDNVVNPEAYPVSGMGGANVGPEFTENEYDGLMELTEIEEQLYQEDKVVIKSDFKNILWDAVIKSGRWKKWILGDENANDFYSIGEQRKLWLIKTGCRYVWTKPEVEVARMKLYQNLENNGIKAEKIVLSRIEKSMDKYFYSFNLVGFNSLIK